MISFKLIIIFGCLASLALSGLIMLEPGMMPLVENWPELMGMSSKQAISKLHQHFPKIQVKVKLGMPETSHIELNKIFLHVDQFDKVIYIPTLYSKVPLLRSWPELIDKTVKEAEDMIYNEFPAMQLEILKVNDIPTTSEEYSPMKVRVVVGEDGLIAEAPTNAQY